MLSNTRACLLEFTKNYRAAISVNEMKQLVVDPSLSTMPLAPIYCRHTFPWYNRLLPCMDITTILSSGAIQPSPSKHLVVVCFQDPSSNSLNYGALFVRASPQIITVDDDKATELPKHPYTWKTITHSCFSDRGVETPILNLPLIFSKRFCQQSQAFFKYRSKRFNEIRQIEKKLHFS
jgi:chemotaxis signal transduction protein